MIKKIESYFGTKRCCDCGSVGSYIIWVDSYKLTVCRLCLDNYTEEEPEEEEESNGF